MSTTPENLTDKEEAFCQEYIIDFNKTQAAIRAGYSKKSAGNIGEQNYRKLHIQKRIEELLQKRAEKLELTQDKVLKDLEEFKNLAKQEKQLAPGVRASELQGKHLGMFVEKHDVKQDLTIKLIDHYGNDIDKPEKSDKSGK